MRNSELENRLQEWAEFIGRDSHGLGYPSLNVLGRLQRDGGILERGYGAKTPPENARAQEIEEIVSELATSTIKLYQRAAEVLRQRYIYKSAETLDTQIAQRMHICISTYYLYLKTAKNWIERKLENPKDELPTRPSELRNKHANVISFRHLVVNY